MKPQSGPDTAAKDWPPRWAKQRRVMGRPLKRETRPYHREAPGRDRPDCETEVHRV
jgi:hypothetical protein